MIRRCLSRVTGSLFVSRTFAADFLASPCALRPNIVVCTSDYNIINYNAAMISNQQAIKTTNMANRRAGAWPFAGISK